MFEALRLGHNLPFVTAKRNIAPKSTAARAPKPLLRGA